MPVSAGVASIPARLLCFNDYVTRQKEGKETYGRWEVKRRRAAGETKSGFSERKDNRDGLSC